MQSSSRGKAKVRLLAVHTTEGIMRAADLRAWTSWSGSSHASADETGVLLSGAGDGFVGYDRSAWTMLSANPISDQIELCAWAKWKRGDWLARPLLLDACARWLAERSTARGIPLVHLTVDEIRAGKPGVIGHVDWTNAVEGTHTDPGPGFPWDVVLDRATAYAGGQTPPSEEDDMFNPAADPYMQSMNGKLDRATIASEATVAILSGDISDGLDRMAEIWIRDGKTQDEVAALRAQVERLASGGQVAPGGAPLDLDALADKLADKLAARLAS